MASLSSSAARDRTAAPRASTPRVGRPVKRLGTMQGNAISTLMQSPIEGYTVQDLVSNQQLGGFYVPRPFAEMTADTLYEQHRNIYDFAVQCGYVSWSRYALITRSHMLTIPSSMQRDPTPRDNNTVPSSSKKRKIVMVGYNTVRRPASLSLSALCLALLMPPPPFLLNTGDRKD